MDRKKLHRFFEGEATKEEKRAIKQWLETSADHKDELFKEREFFDALILSDHNKASRSFAPKGKRISLSKWMWEIGKVAVIAIILITIGFHLYNRKMEEIRLATHTVIVPAGQRANILLPDGTHVWLNACSEISYPAFFSGSNREIELNGEAYFEVKHNARQPFIVHTQQYDIEVLGTSFNVESYPDSHDFSAALMEGMIEVTNRIDPVDHLKLSPDQKVTVVNGRLIPQSIDDFDIYRWREGLICFKETPFEELMKRFEKCFGIEIIVQKPQLGEKVFGGKFRLSDGIDSALRILQKEGGYTFERNSEDTIIYIR